MTVVKKFVIKGGKPLTGTIRLAGNKNSILGLIPASLLANSPVTLTNVPDIRDVSVMCQLIEKLGAKVVRKGDELTIDPTTLSSYKLDSELSERIRASVVLAAPLLARFGRAQITLPGGDQIGERLLDTHFLLLKDMGVEINPLDHKTYELNWKQKKDSNLFLEEASVTATIMGLILASSIEFETKIEDAAGEPHVQNIAECLTEMGANIEGAGTNKILIKGSSFLEGVSHKVYPDHIEGGTFAIAAAVTGGNVLIEDFYPEHYKMILNYFSHMGVKYEIKDKTLRVMPSKLISDKKRFQTRPWPGFATDLMSPFIVLATQTEGTVMCHDWMYEWRVFFVDDLISMGANIFIADPHRVIIEGPTKLNGVELFCKDIRAGISIILAALAAQGVSTINNVEIVERGYQNIDKRLQVLGADIKVITNGQEA